MQLVLNMACYDQGVFVFFFFLQDMGVNVTISNQDVILNSDIIILAVKPYQILDVMKEIHDTYTAVQQHAGKASSSPRSFRPLIVSVAASVTLADIEEKVRQSNTFCLV